MRIFAGLSRTDYEELFRAIGALIDERGWTNVTLMEVNEGLIVQATPRAAYRQHEPDLETYLLTDGDLERVMREAVLRRDQPAAPPTPILERRRPIRDENSADPDEPMPSHPVSTPPSLSDWHQATNEPPLPRFDLEMEEDHDAAPAAGLANSFGAAHRQLAALSPEDPPAPADTGIDAGAARAAVVMAHIVASRLKSGLPLTGDDPDLASLLEQVRALDESGIGG